MKTIKPIKKLNCLTALEVFRQIPIKTTGLNWSKHGMLRGMFYLQANPKDERFDSRYNLTINPYKLYIFNLEDSSEDLGLLLVSGKRPCGLNLRFDNHLDNRKTWSYLGVWDRNKQWLFFNDIFSYDYINSSSKISSRNIRLC